MFSLPWKFATPDVLFTEELEKQHGCLLEFGLICKTMSGDLVAEAYALYQKYAKPSVNDMLALTLAKHEDCQLLTGDKALKKVAQKFSVEVHGTIWLVEKMLKYKRISCEVAHVGFQRMRDSGSHLPWNKIEKLLCCYKDE